MSGVDVIELGSSDEEVQEPKPKKIKPQPNAMVHIPGKLPEVTITPTVASNSKLQHGNSSTFGSKLLNREVVHMSKMSHLRGGKVNSKVARPAGNMVMNPLGKIKCVLSAKLTNKPKPHIVTQIPSNKLLQNPIKVHNAITNLPPSITVKRTKGHFVHDKGHLGKRPIKRKFIGHGPSNIVQTVDLDDDEPATVPPPVGPQWYVRPEDQTAENDQEKTNNEEPENKNMIEITIEDSPVKPTSKKAKAENSDFTVTIEDSPVRPVICKTPPNNNDKGIPKQKKSQKVLEYPKKHLEIEIEPMIEHQPNTTSETQNDVANGPVFEVLESPMKVPDEVTQSPKNVKPNTKPPPPIIKDNNDIISIEDDTESTEFHPVYQSFIDLCFKLENSDDMKKIVEKKIKAYYRQVPKNYTESEDFIDMVSSKILSMTAGPDKMYLYIKDIVDELNLQRKMAQNSVKDVDDNKKNEAETFLYGENSQFDAKRQRQIRKLEKTIKKLHRAIQKLEEQEVDFDDEDDSVYLLTERYKERMIKVHAKFCQLTNTKMPSEPRIYIDTTPGKPPGAARRLEKWINHKVPIGAPLPFPDFHDVLRCVREANVEDQIGWNEVDIMEEARSLFVRCGRKLQRRRQENEWRLAASRISADIDPAENDEKLKKELDENRKTAANRETDVFNKFADRQNQLKLEAEEIGDKEADESPVDSEEDDVEENVSLDNKEKRKERLKRLLQDKSTNNKENNDAELLCNDIEIKELQGNIEQVKETQIEKRTEENNSKSETINENLSSSNNMDIDSDIDELHLLQKLHSEDEANRSYSESSDSASPISISDTLSDTDEEKDMSDDVISIENSSFSETDTNVKKDNLDKSDIVCSSYEEQKKDEANIPGSSKLSKMVESEFEVGDELCKTVHEESDERSRLSIEGILLASSEDSNSQSNTPIVDTCVNLNDDAISIGETSIKSVYEIQSENTLAADDSGDAALQQTDSQDSQPNEDILLASEDETCETNEPTLESCANVISESIVAAIESEVNPEANNKNGYIKNADFHTAADATSSKVSDNLLSEGILLASSEDDASQDGNTVLVPQTDSSVTINDNVPTTSVTNKNSEDMQHDATETNEEINSTKLHKTETELTVAVDEKSDSQDLKNPAEDGISAVMMVSEESINDSELKTTVDETIDTDKDKELCNRNLVTLNEACEEELDGNIRPSNKVCETQSIEIEISSKPDTLMESQLTENTLQNS